MVVVATEGTNVDMLGVMITCLGSEIAEVEDDTDLTAIWVEELRVGHAIPCGFTVWVGIREIA